MTHIIRFDGRILHVKIFVECNTTTITIDIIQTKCKSFNGFSLKYFESCILMVYGRKLLLC